MAFDENLEENIHCSFSIILNSFLSKLWDTSTWAFSKKIFFFEKALDKAA